MELHPYIYDVISDKENELRWKTFYDAYILRLYYLDKHCNLIHKKARIAKQGFGTLFAVGQITILEDMEDIIMNSVVTPLITWF